MKEPEGIKVCLEDIADVRTEQPMSGGLVKANPVPGILGKACGKALHVWMLCRVGKLTRGLAASAADGLGLDGDSVGEFSRIGPGCSGTGTGSLTVHHGLRGSQR